MAEDDGKAMRDRLEALQSRIRQAERRAEVSEQRRAQTESRSRELEQQAASQRARIAALEAQVAGAGSDAVASEVATLEGRLRAIEQRQAVGRSAEAPPAGCCARCGATRMVPVGLADSDGLAVKVLLNLDPRGETIFGKTLTGEMSATLCAACGFMELTATDALSLESRWAEVQARIKAGKKP